MHKVLLQSIIFPYIERSVFGVYKKTVQRLKSRLRYNFNTALMGVMMVGVVIIMTASVCTRAIALM